MIESEIKNVQQKPACGRTANVLIVGNDTQTTGLILKILARKAIRGIVVNDRTAAIGVFEKNSCDAVFTSDKIVFSARTDSPAQLQNTFNMLAEIKMNLPELPVVIIADAHKPDANSILPIAVKAINAGCCDFLIKPLDTKKIELLLDTIIPNHKVSTQIAADENINNIYSIIGRSAKLIQTISIAEKIAPTSVPVLISGESGTGKELISYLVHNKSKRSNAPYIRVNCAALSDSLLESELFGHEKGAFTGACAQRKGRFEMAHGGTLLLDEISETPIKFQSKLLRILEQQDFERVGGNENIKVNVRIISTTNKNLLQEVRLGRFRQDLYWRLSGARLIIPPLRERAEDMEDLIWHFINIYAKQKQRRIARIDPAMLNIFTKYHWPGNIRQLKNVVVTSLFLGTGDILSLADASWLFDEMQPLEQTIKDEIKPDAQIEKQQIDPNLAGIKLKQVERKAILDTLDQTDGNQRKAAEILGISDRTLRDKIHKYRNQECLQPV